ncbi:DUF6894 family protein [Croceibacterium ferulae]|uniref:DUF6894 family protein n=1 Tax=Croceibacterium ferulae TaxID=1854641 RepID=UPI000F865E1F|nr:hypothetical protein [Croceibacterium ferulae]
MPAYSINVRTPSHIADVHKVESDDLEGLRVEMAKSVGELLKDHAEQIWADQDWQVDVTDDSGLILYVINVSAIGSPATLGSAASLGLTATPS